MKPKMNISPIPDAYICLSYDIIYDDYTTVNPVDFIKEIPTLPMLHFVVGLQNKVLYAFSDISTQKQMIYGMCGFLKMEEKQRVWQFLKKNQNVIFITNTTSLLFFQLALSNYEALGNGEDCTFLYPDEIVNIYKALLYCNQKWTNQQMVNAGKLIHDGEQYPLDLIGLSLHLDLPIVEFKLYKDFKTQFYKAICFFEFCEKDKLFSTYLTAFYADHKVSHWKEYVLRLFDFFAASLNGQYIKMDEAHLTDKIFFNQYTINVTDSEIKSLWDKENLTYLRNHFLVLVSPNYYLLLNANLLVDKLYQGMKFDFFESVKRHNLLDDNNRKYESYKDFSAVLGCIFSEQNLLYPILTKCYKSNADKILSGDFLKSEGVSGAPDFYIRQGNILYLFEHKDLILGDTVKYSSDVDEIKNAILERLCFDGVVKGKGKRKGGGQLLFTINAIFNENFLADFDSGISNIRHVYPIIITTDTAFSAIGVNALVNLEFSNLVQTKYHFSNTNVFIRLPLILDYDTLLKLSWRIATNKLSLASIIDIYLRDIKNGYKLVPFSTYIIDSYLRGKKVSEQENDFLLGDKLN